MRRKRFQGGGGALSLSFSILILPPLLVLLPLFGCTPAVDLSSDSASQIAVTSIREDPSVTSTSRALLATSEISLLSSSHPAMAGPGALPFVRSRPKFVAPFPLILNEAVQGYIDDYLAQPQGLRESFQRSRAFMPEMLSLFQDDGLPLDLVYLSFAESRFSPDGAGPWQLSRATARRYGLTINHWLDERRDPIKSTRAAAEYLAELHDQTGTDWRMTLVAWNNGDEGVNRYLRLMTAPYEHLMRRLPRRTRALMNRFMAVALIAHHAKEYGISAASTPSTTCYRVIAVDGDTPLSTVAQVNHTSVAALRSLNPALLCDRTPPGPQSYPVRIPDHPDEAKLFSTTS
jgi:Transglycosylase SLT domain